MRRDEMDGTVQKVSGKPAGKTRKSLHQKELGSIPEVNPLQYFSAQSLILTNLCFVLCVCVLINLGRIHCERTEACARARVYVAGKRTRQVERKERSPHSREEHGPFRDGNCCIKACA